MKFGFEKLLTAYFILLIAGAFILGILFHQNSRALNDTGKWVVHTHEVLFESEQVLTAARDLQSATRGFVITGDSSFITVVSDDEYILKHVSNLRQLTADNRAQQVNIARLEGLIKRRIGLSRRTVLNRACLKTGNRSGILL